jgi:hypothetical protein
MSSYTPRYEGTRWKIYFGDYTGVQKFAVNELQKAVQKHMPYVVEVHEAAAERPDADVNAVLVGSPSDNQQIAHLVELGLLPAPTAPEGYSIACMDSPWRFQRRVVWCG